jgi:hypothetical protein
LRLALGALVLALSSAAHAQPKPVFVTADRVAVRYSSPDTGGASRPRFLTGRTLAFEARLVSLAEEGSLAYQDRHVRTALDLHIGRDMLAALPLDKEPDAPTLARVAATLRQALLDRIGGAEALARAAHADGISDAEIEAFFRRDARAALYVEKAINPVLYPSENQLRDVFRTTANPYRDKNFDDVREGLSRWLVSEKVRSSESSFLQTARSRVVLIYVAPEE